MDMLPIFLARFEHIVRLLPQEVTRVFLNLLKDKSSCAMSPQKRLFPNRKQRGVGFMDKVSTDNFEQFSAMICPCSLEALRFELPIGMQPQVVLVDCTPLMNVFVRGRGRGGRGRGISHPQDEMTEEERRFISVQQRIDDVEESYSETTDDSEKEHDVSTDEKKTPKKNVDLDHKKRGRPKTQPKGQDDRDDKLTKLEMEQRVSDFQYIHENSMEWKDVKLSSTKKKFLGSYRVETNTGSSPGISPSPQTPLSDQSPKLSISDIVSNPVAIQMPISMLSTPNVSDVPKLQSYKIPKKMIVPSSDVKK
jgi:hypothetical protein